MNISMHGSEQGFFKYYSSFLIVWPVPISGCTYNVQKSLAKMGQRDMSLVLFSEKFDTWDTVPVPVSHLPVSHLPKSRTSQKKEGQ